MDRLAMLFFTNSRRMTARKDNMSKRMFKCHKCGKVVEITVSMQDGPGMCLRCFRNLAKEIRDKSKKAKP